MQLIRRNQNGNGLATGEFDTLRQQMDRLFDQLMGGWGMLRSTPETPTGIVPNAEVYMTDHDVVVTAELPGLEARDLNVEITEQAVYMGGEIKRENEVKEDGYYRSERHFGRFDRVIQLPARIKESEATAALKNGLLTIRAPLAEHISGNGRKLEIQVQ